MHEHEALNRPTWFGSWQDRYERANDWKMIFHVQCIFGNSANTPNGLPYTTRLAYTWNKLRKCDAIKRAETNTFQHRELRFSAQQHRGVLWPIDFTTNGRKQTKRLLQTETIDPSFFWFPCFVNACASIAKFLHVALSLLSHTCR